MVQLPGPPPTVDDLRENLSAIYAEEELKRHDSPPDPDPPLARTPPCECTLVAHETRFVRWIKARQLDSGHPRGELKCPQCGQLHEFEGVNPAVLRILNALNDALSGYGSAIRARTWTCPANITVLPFVVAAASYLAYVAYGAFAIRMFLGPGAFHALLTANPTHWPWHAWINLPLIPLLLIASNSSAPPRNDNNVLLFALALLGSSSPLVLWTTSPLIPLLYPWPATAGPRGLSLRPSETRPPLWPPHPTLVCALFPVVRALYGRLRERATQVVAERDKADQREGAQQQHQQQPPAPAAARADHPFPFPIGDRYLAKIVHSFFPSHNVPAPAPAPAGTTSPAADATAPSPDNPAAAAADQDQDQPQPPRQERAPEPRDANGLCALAARAMRMLVPATSTGAALCALAMPILAWAMGTILLSISRAVPLVGPIIAVGPRPRALRSAPSFVGWLGRPARRLFGGGGADALLRGFGGFLAMSDTWAAGDPVWWRNILGLGIFFMVNDGLKIRRLWLAKRRAKAPERERAGRRLDAQMEAEVEVGKVLYTIRCCINISS